MGRLTVQRSHDIAELCSLLLVIFHKSVDRRMFVSSEDGIFQRFYGAFSTNGNSGMVYPITSLNHICKILNCQIVQVFQLHTLAVCGQAVYTE